MRTMKTLVLLLAVVTTCVACEKDVASTLTVEPTINEGTGKVVSRADIVNSLWGLGEDLNPDAVCIANSVFAFLPETGFQIQKNADPNEYNSADAIIVSSVNLKITGEGIERGEGCPEGDLQYLVSASPEAPIDIESSEELAGRYSIAGSAKSTPTPFPSTCAVTAHFEKHGNMAALNETPDVGEGEVVEDADLESAPEETAPEEPIYSLKLVVTERNCSLQ